MAAQGLAANTGALIRGLIPKSFTQHIRRELQIISLHRRVHSILGPTILTCCRRLISYSRIRRPCQVRKSILLFGTTRMTSPRTRMKRRKLNELRDGDEPRWMEAKSALWRLEMRLLSGVEHGLEGGRTMCSECQCGCFGRSNAGILSQQHL